MVDAKWSLVWWQVDPHLNHLWATTCPAEPSWQPGEGRSTGWSVRTGPDLKTYTFANVSDTIHVPLYPRRTARPLCKEAVQGHLVVSDAANGRGARGEVIIRADSLVMGEERRAQYAREMVFETVRYPEIRFQLDSVVNVTRQADTLHGRPSGSCSARYEKPVSAVACVSWTRAGGTRVLARIREPARTFVSFSRMPIAGASSGRRTDIWFFFFGWTWCSVRRSPSGTQWRSLITRDARRLERCPDGLILPQAEGDHGLARHLGDERRMRLQGDAHPLAVGRLGDQLAH